MMKCPECNVSLTGCNGPPYCHVCGFQAPGSRPKKSQRIKVRFLFRWYDFWIGWYWDSAKRRLYVLPIPCFGTVIEFPPKKGSLGATRQKDSRARLGAP